MSIGNINDWNLFKCFGYVINSCQPDIDDINGINLNKTDASNFFIMDYLTKREQNINKKELFEINVNLAKEFEIEDTKNITTNFGNFYCTKKPVSLSEARKQVLDKNIEQHIIVCGIVKGVKNLILPLRSRF